MKKNSQEYLNYLVRSLLKTLKKFTLYTEREFFLAINNKIHEIVFFRTSRTTKNNLKISHRCCSFFVSE